MANAHITYFTGLVSLIFLLSAHSAFAAVIAVLPAQKNFSVGEEFSINVKIDSEGTSINAAQATINWSMDVLELVEAEKAGSIFNFWVDERHPSNASSSLYFIGGTTKGISGSSLQMLKIKFKARSLGTALVTISNAAITASDGHGTDVLSGVKNGSYHVGAQGLTVKLPDTGDPTLSPARVAREAIFTIAVPTTPDIVIPLYPDQSKWNNHLGELMVLWEVPDDVTRVALYLDRNPNTLPQNAEKVLTTGKALGILGDGIWYIHVRFGGNVGWGAVAHYRIALDTQPPLPFDLKLLEGTSTDNPAPKMEWSTGDELSGIKEYQVQIDNGEVIQLPASSFDGSFVLPLQRPGKHRVVVRAIDEASNSIEDEVTLNILPIASPGFTFVTKELFSDQHRGLTVMGTAQPHDDVLLDLMKMVNDTKSELALARMTKADDKGNWEFTFDQPLRNGQYKVTAQSKDSRSAYSLLVISEAIQVKSTPIIQLGPLQMGSGAALLSLLVILLMSFGSGVWFYKKHQDKLVLRVLFAESEVSKMFSLIMDDVKQLSAALLTKTNVDDDYALTRLKNDIQKMELYIKKGIEKIKR